LGFISSASSLFKAALLLHPEFQIPTSINSNWGCRTVSVPVCGFDEFGIFILISFCNPAFKSSNGFSSSLWIWLKFGIFILISLIAFNSACVPPFADATRLAHIDIDVMISTPTFQQLQYCRRAPTTDTTDIKLWADLDWVKHSLSLILIFSLRQPNSSTLAF